MGGEEVSSAGEAARGGDRDDEPRVCVTVPARNGTWHAYAEDDGRVEPGWLLAVHQDTVAEIEPLRARAIPVSSVNVEGGRVAVADAAVRDDRTVIDELRYPIFTILLGRGVHHHTGGDGEFAVRAVLQDGQAVYLDVPFG